MEFKKQEERLVKSFNVDKDNVEIKSNEKDFAIVKAYVSIFNNIDRAGDMIVKGAFSKSLANKLPKVCWCHEWNNIIGKVISAEEDNKGLLVEMQITKNTQQGAEAIELMKMGAMDEFSIGYQVNDYEFKTTPDNKPYTELKEIELFEVSPVLVGCNPATELLSVKSEENIETKEDTEKNDPQNCEINSVEEENNDIIQNEDKNAENEEESQINANEEKTEEKEAEIVNIEEENDEIETIEDLYLQEDKIEIVFAGGEKKVYNVNNKIKELIACGVKDMEEKETANKVKVDKKILKILKSSVKDINKQTNYLIRIIKSK